MVTVNPGARAGQALLVQSGKVLLILSSVLVALLSARYVLLGLDNAFEGPIFDGLLADHRGLFAAHVIAGPVALGLGALQFSSRLRNRLPVLHRWNGRAYGLAALVGGGAGLILAMTAISDRPWAGLGFGLLAVLWIFTMVRGVQAARKGAIADHRRMMIFSFALAFSAVTLRVQLGLFGVAGYGYEDVSQILAWSCWVPNLLVAFWYVSHRAAVIGAPSFLVETGVSK